MGTEIANMPSCVLSAVWNKTNKETLGKTKQNRKSSLKYFARDINL